MFDSKKLLDTNLGGGIGEPQSGLGDVVGQTPSDESAKRQPIADRSFGSIVRQVLQEASSGLKDVAREVEARTGVGTKADEMLKQATGRPLGTFRLTLLFTHPVVLFWRPCKLRAPSKHTPRR